jgi:hypothetical protein
MGGGYAGQEYRPSLMVSVPLTASTKGKRKHMPATSYAIRYEERRSNLRSPPRILTLMMHLRQS